MDSISSERLKCIPQLAGVSIVLVVPPQQAAVTIGLVAPPQQAGISLIVSTLPPLVGFKLASVSVVSVATA